ncbi:unnamed protein product [Pleuronectes platessa]|uniref:Uncharacterized protein n=1 Tax=Pleuronectes platessa TaxID=8262 RepID=A0A9N7VU23_PLEPL|nr:unnamed protein product [Pleuronectes platessa]
METSQDPATTKQNSFCSSQHISYLIQQLAQENANLNTEYHWRIQLSRELEEHRQELCLQKKLKEMFINRGKETKQELEQLQKYSNAEALSATKIASQVNNTIKRKNKKDLQKDYEELKVAYIINQEKFNHEIQLEKDKTNILKVEMENLIASYDDFYQIHITDQEKFNSELQEEKKKNNVLQKELKKLKASYHEVCQRQPTNQEKFNSELQEEKRMKYSLQEGLENLKVSYHEVSQSLATNDERFDSVTAPGGNRPQNNNDQHTPANPAFGTLVHHLQNVALKPPMGNKQNGSVIPEDSPLLRIEAIDNNSSRPPVEQKRKKKNVFLTTLEKLRVTYDEVFKRSKPIVSRTELNEDKSLSNVLLDEIPKETGLPEKTDKPKKASLCKRVRHLLGLRRRGKKSAAPTSPSN